MKWGQGSESGATQLVMTLTSDFSSCHDSSLNVA